MGNLQCPAEDAGHLAAVARNICPFPNYNPSLHFSKMLSINSSHHLREHYIAVQNSLTPKQLEDFTQSLRTTFGKEGKVAFGGFGLVALSLAVLFDTLAKQVRGEVALDLGPIAELFVKEPRGYYPPHVYTMSKCLKLIPHIANNPTRMRQETEKCYNQIMADNQALQQLRQNHMLPYGEDLTEINLMISDFFDIMLRIHLLCLTNMTSEQISTYQPKVKGVETFNLNCDPVAADKVFLANVENSDNYTKEAFQRCKPQGDFEPKSWLAYIAKLELIDTLATPIITISKLKKEEILGQRLDFDLKANALGKWA